LLFKLTLAMPRCCFYRGTLYALLQVKGTIQFREWKMEFLMKAQVIRLTEFREQKLRCIGGDGRATPYQITTSVGRELGRFDQILPPADIVSANSRIDQQQPSLLRRLATIFS
jgi:hypothetical protein